MIEINKELLLQALAGAIYAGAAAIVATTDISWTTVFWAPIIGAAIKGGFHAIVRAYRPASVTNAAQFKYSHWTEKVEKWL